MKHQVATLEGALLDTAVAKAEGWGQIQGGAWAVQKWVRGLGDEQIDCSEVHRAPLPWSTSWAVGGPIIEREQIDTRWKRDVPAWEATLGYDSTFLQRQGPTPLIAAMRAYVASKFGDEISLP